MEKLRSWIYIKKMNDYKSKGTCGVKHDIELLLSDTHAVKLEDVYSLLSTQQYQRRC